MSKPNRMSVVRAKRGGGKHKTKHVLIRPTDNGAFITEHHMEPATDQEKDQPWSMKPEENAHADWDSAVGHLNGIFGKDKKAAAPQGEPDGDEGEEEEE